ncbi:MAG: hypothetical protein LBT59_26140 [Clostridiales bacterium]|jgi:transposase InsO family protein|nr:hypothetical protein [Clostridiales bacterium]
MESKTKEKIALFRFSMIAPVVSGTIKASADEYFKMAAESPHRDLDGEMTKPTYEELKEWFERYRKDGLSGLYPSYKDNTESTELSAEVVNAIRKIKLQHPQATGTHIYEMLLENGNIDSSIKLGAFLRSLRINDLNATSPNKEPKAFEMSKPNELWQSAITAGPKLEDDQIVRLYAILDDNSRMIVGARYFLGYGDDAVKQTLREAFLNCGIPQSLSLGSDPACDSEEVDEICEALDIEAIHCSRIATGKIGKIKRFFRTLNDRWLTSVPTPPDLDSLNAGLGEFIELYNNIVHSGTNMTPKARWTKSSQRIRRLPPEKIESAF